MVIFISHSFEDKAAFEEIARELKKEGIPCWNPESMRAGATLSEQLRKAIEQSELCIFVATNNSVSSPWCSAELGAFWGAGKPVVIYIADSSLEIDKLPRQFEGHFIEQKIHKVIKVAKENSANIQEYSGEWYAAHISSDEDGEYAISVHTYHLIFYPSGKVTGEIIDHLSYAKYKSRVEGLFANDRRLVMILRPENEPWLLGAQFHYRLSPTEVNVGIVSSFDRQNKPFSTYIALCKGGKFNIQEFRQAIKDQKIPLLFDSVPENLIDLPQFPRFEEYVNGVRLT